MSRLLRPVVVVTGAFGILQMVIAWGLLGASRVDHRFGDEPTRATQVATVAAEFPFIDVHAHLDPSDAAGSIAKAVQAMRAENATGFLFLPPPFSPDSTGPYDQEVLISAERGHGQELGFLGGGGTLNVMIQQAIRGKNVSAEFSRKFKARAEKILEEGAVGFGEMSAEHLATGPGTYYENAPPDETLFLSLADISAEHGGVPIDLHMEAVPEVMPLPSEFKSPPNPPRLRANVAAFERLLAHNSRATIVWAHAGCDNTGYRTTELMRRLLLAHPNLYMEIKVDPMAPGKNSPLDGGGSGAIKSQWLQLFRDFPDRFVIGSDQHYPEPPAASQRWQSAVLLLNELPPDLRSKIGRENAVRIYHLAGGALGKN